MRFSRHLSSHLTPEWRKQYIQYAELKKLVYEMVGSKKTLLHSRPHNREELYSEEGGVEVDESLQDDFFSRVESQLQSIHDFFQFEESRLHFPLSALKKKVIQLGTTKVHKSHKQRQVLKRALSELYLNLVLLQNFQQLNHTGFRKILKKHDKLTRSTRGNRVFRDKVCKAYFWTSKLVTDMLNDAERTMIQLEEGNRTKAMNRLRVPPLGKEHKRSHWISFFAGLFSGLLILSIAVLCFAFSAWDIEEVNFPHFEPTMRGMRGGLLLSVWCFGFAINTYGWRRAGVNNVLIFEFDPRNYLNFIELFAVAGMIAVIWIAGMYLIAFSPWLHIPLYVGPLLVYGVLASVLFLPLPILRHRSRIWLMKTLGRIVCAPFFKVKFADFWIADQLTSLGLVLLDIEYFFCYLVYGRNSPEGALISCGTGTYGLRVILAVLPSWWRFAQCMRRYYDTKQVNPHLINAGKYSTSFFVVAFSALANTTIREGDGLTFLDQSVLYMALFSLWMVSGVVATSYKFSWDILMDWSLFPNIPRHCCQRKSLVLRKDKIYTYRFYYVLALIENFLLRIVWVLTVIVGHHVARIDDNNIISTITGIMEVVRRFIWNFFRVENEHVNNVGQFRAVRDISLYPVDLSNQADEEDNDDPTLDRRGSLERRASLERRGDLGKKRKKVKRSLSKTLLDLNDTGGNANAIVAKLRKGKTWKTPELENQSTDPDGPIPRNISESLMEISGDSESRTAWRQGKPRFRNHSSISATELVEVTLEDHTAETYYSESEKETTVGNPRSPNGHRVKMKKPVQRKLSNSLMEISAESEGNIAALANRWRKGIKPRSRKTSSISATIPAELFNVGLEEDGMAEFHGMNSPTEPQHVLQFSSSPPWGAIPSHLDQESLVQLNMQEHETINIGLADTPPHDAITAQHDISLASATENQFHDISPDTSDPQQHNLDQDVGSPPFGDIFPEGNVEVHNARDSTQSYRAGQPTLNNPDNSSHTREGYSTSSLVTAPHNTGSPPSTTQDHSSNFILPQDIGNPSTSTRLQEDTTPTMNPLSDDNTAHDIISNPQQDDHDTSSQPYHCLAATHDTTNPANTDHATSDTGSLPQD